MFGGLLLGLPRVAHGDVVVEALVKSLPDLVNMTLPQLVGTLTRGTLAGLAVGCDFLLGHFLVVQYPELPSVNSMAGPSSR